MASSRRVPGRLAGLWRRLRWVAKSEPLEPRPDEPTPESEARDTFVRWLFRREELPLDPPTPHRGTSDERALRRLFARESLPLDPPPPSESE